MSNFLKYIDIVGKEFKFNIDNEETFKASLGGIISIIYYIGIISLFCFFGKELIIKQDPNFIQRFEMQDDYPFTTLNESNFFISVSLSGNSDNLALNNRFFDVNLLFTNNFNGSWVNTNIEKYIDCNEISYLPKKEINKLKYHYCFNINYVIGGYWDSKYVSYPTILISRCNIITEKTYNITCATDEEMKASVSGSIIVNFLVNNRVMYPQNFTYPIKRFDLYYSVAYNYDPKEVYNYELFYNKANVATDSGLIFESVNDTLNFLEFDYLRNYNGKLAYLDNYILSIRVFLSKKKSYYSRTYIRLQDVVANVMAFIDLILMILKFIYDFYLDNEYSVFLYKKIFKLQFEEEECNANSSHQLNKIPFKSAVGSSNILKKEELELYKLKVLDLKNSTNHNHQQNINYNNKTNPDENADINSNKPLSNKKVESSIDNKENNEYNEILSKNTSNNSITKFYLNKDLRNIISSKSKPKKEVEVNFKERCDLLLCFNSKKYTNKEEKLKQELIMAADKIISQKSDIFELWKVLDQFKLLKKFLLNENQCFMLSNIGLKDLVNRVLVDKETKVENQKLSYTYDHSDLKNIQEIKEENSKLKLIEYYKIKNKSNQSNDIDHLLWHYLDDDLKQNIQENLMKI